MAWRTGDKIDVELEKLHADMGTFKGDQHARVLFDDGRWTEGPCYSPLWRSVIFSDAPNDRVLRYSESTGRVEVFREPAGHHNGHAFDGQGRLHACSHGLRGIVRLEHDGSETVLAYEYRRKPLNSPNDIVVKRDGTVWFSDPVYGITGSYEGYDQPVEQAKRNLFRIDIDGSLHSVLDTLEAPNGLAFSPDESTLYVANSSKRELWRYPVEGNGLGAGTRIAVCEAGPYDGIRVDEYGRIWGATHEGLHCLSPEGKLLGRLKIPTVCSNLAFGGDRGTILYITAGAYLLAVMTNVRGVGFAREAETA